MDFSGKVSHFAVIIKKPQVKFLPELRKQFYLLYPKTLQTNNH